MQRANTEIVNSNLSGILDIPYEPEIVDSIPETLPAKLGSLPPLSLDDDAIGASQHIKNLLEVSNEAIQELFRVAVQSQEPRAYEVLAALIKNTGELNLSIMDIHKKKSDVENKVGKSNINVDKAVVFAGSTAELIKLIKENKDNGD